MDYFYGSQLWNFSYRRNFCLELHSRFFLFWWNLPILTQVKREIIIYFIHKDSYKTISLLPAYHVRFVWAMRMRINVICMLLASDWYQITNEPHPHCCYERFNYLLLSKGIAWHEVHRQKSTTKPLIYFSLALVCVCKCVYVCTWHCTQRNRIHTWLIIATR